nr:hypothetical protein [uncultured Acidovorax sp.]
MHVVLQKIAAHLTRTMEQVNTHVPADQIVAPAHGQPSFPSLTREDLHDEAQSVFFYLVENQCDELSPEAETALEKFDARFAYFNSHTVPLVWSNPQGALPAYTLTLQALRRALEKWLRPPDSAALASATVSLNKRVRNVTARLNEIEPKTNELAAMIAHIEQAHEAADQLPTDIADLKERRDHLNKLLDKAIVNSGQLDEMRISGEAAKQFIDEKLAEADAVLKRCETAYAAATSVGLASAFSERSDKLNKTIQFWIWFLVIALGTGSCVGYWRVLTLSDLLKEGSLDPVAVALNLLLALLSVGAPIWLGWLATKQINQRFRLAEDYAYKASISRAYEGFRREAAQVDKTLEAQLLASALGRFDEQPLRLVEREFHGSPWHEVIASDVAKEAMRVVPNLASQLKEFMASTVASARNGKINPTPPKVDESAKSGE